MSECLCDVSAQNFVIDALHKGVLKALKFLHQEMQRVFYDLWPAQVILLGERETLKTLLIDFESVQWINKSPSSKSPIKRGPNALQEIEKACETVDAEHDLRRYVALVKYVESGHTVEFSAVDYNDDADKEMLKGIRDIYDKYVFGGNR